MLEKTFSPNRRRWMESAGLLALGSALSAKIIQSPGSVLPASRRAPVLAKTPPPPPSPAEQLVLDTPEPPEPPQPEYALFLAHFRFRHIQPVEIIRPHLRARNGVANTLPPRELWRNMPASLFVADEIRHRLGRPLNFITSAYRNPAYNRQCGGASRSWHTQNCALDLVYEGGSRAAYEIALELREEGFFQGGIGLYDTFIHIDTRGKNASWTG